MPIKTRLYRILLAVYLFLLSIGSLQPARLRSLHHTSVFHMPLHIFAFAALVLLSRAAFPVRPGQVLLSNVSFAVTLEFLQHLGSHLPMEWPDVEADWVGLAIGSLVRALLSSSV